MPKLIIPNQSGKEIKQATIDLETGNVVMSNRRKCLQTDILKPNESLHHPILETAPLKMRGKDMEFFYQNNQELCSYLNRIYPTFFHNKNPNSLSIKLTEKNYIKSENEEIYLSPYKNQVANKTLNSNTLSELVTKITGSPFRYSNKISVNATFKLSTLPEIVNADALFAKNIDLPKIKNIAADLSFFELRFINHKVGFGVFARKFIPKKTLLFIYTGLWQDDRSDNGEYRFYETKTFNLSINARHQGNLSRFINHANNKYSNPIFKAANVYSQLHLYCGLGLVVIYAKRNIFPQEQLLMNYGLIKDGWPTLYQFSKENKIYDDRSEINTNNKYEKQIQKIICGYLNGEKRWLIFRFCLVFLALGLVILLTDSTP